MNLRRNISFISNSICIVLLVLGLVLPIFSFQVKGSLDSSFTTFKMDVIDETRSIFGTVAELWDRDRFLLAALIFAFSVLVPLLKTIVIFVLAYFMKKSSGKTGEQSTEAHRNKEEHKDRLHRIHRILGVVSKWSMADVFVVALLLTFMSTAGHYQKTTEMISVFAIKIQVEIGLLVDSQLHEGFYYFTGYCMLSMLTVHLLKTEASAKDAS